MAVALLAVVEEAGRRWMGLVVGGVLSGFWWVLAGFNRVLEGF